MTIPTMLVVFGGSIFAKKGEPQEQWKPTLNEATEMEKGMKEFPVKVINGKKQYPFEQYCASKGWITFQENGQLAVTSAFNWQRATKTHSLLQWKREKELEKIFEQFPEEKVAYEQRLDVIRGQVKELFKGVRLQTNAQ